jgi:hypothetical protein
MAGWDHGKMKKLAELDEKIKKVMELWALIDSLLTANIKKFGETESKYETARAKGGLDPSVIPLIKKHDEKLATLRIQLEETATALSNRNATEVMAALCKTTESKESINATSNDDFNEMDRLINEHTVTLGRMNSLCQTQLLELDSLNNDIDRLLKRIQQPS